MRFPRSLASAAAFAVATAFAALGPRGDEPPAPDGHRGLGSATELSDLLSLLRSNKDGDQRFLADLLALKSDVRVLAAGAAEHYRARGDFAVLDPKAEATLGALHARFDEVEADPLPALAAQGPAARPLARMLLDARFRVRRSVLDRTEAEARELTGGMAVLHGATDGFVNPPQHEVQAIAARVDLAASWLRAARNDLTALRPTDALAAGEVALEREVDLLLATARSSEGEGVRRAMVANAVERSRSQAAAMSAQLFTTRLDASAANLFEWRRKSIERAAALRAEALAFLPDTAEGAAASPQIADLGRSERYRIAVYKAREGLGQDPLDPELAWAGGHAADFLFGLVESRAFFDQFLALCGIRAHDHRSIQGRTLDAREREALDAVQRAYQDPSGRASLR